MPTNDFLPFGTAGGAPVLSQSAYAAIVPANGYGAGILPKENFNKAVRQGSVVASMIGSFINSASLDALDNADLSTLLANFILALAHYYPATPDVNSYFTGANQSAAGNGYQKLPGGIIIQWGTVTSAAGTFSFPIAFPTACFAIVGGKADTADSLNVYAYAVSASQYAAGNIASDGTPSPYNVAVSWIAIGH